MVNIGANLFFRESLDFIKYIVFCFNNLFRVNTHRGFIGPIGDDLPSLVPIVVSLLLFFTVFSMTLSTFTSKNIYLSKQIEMTSAARALKGDSLIYGVAQFQDKCTALKSQVFPYNFMAGIYSANTKLSDASADFISVQNNPSDSLLLQAPINPGVDNTLTPYFCEYRHVGGVPFVNSQGKTPKNYLVRFYPVAIQQPVIRTIAGQSITEYLIVPGIMAMVVWE